jgi:transposase
MSYVRMRTEIKNRIRTLLAQQKEEIREMAESQTHLFGTHGMKVLRELELAGRDNEMLKSLMKTYNHLQQCIKQSDALVREICNSCKEARLISTIPGFGRFFSVLVVTEIVDIERFASDRKLHKTCWTAPVLCNEKVYVRNTYGSIACINLKPLNSR